MEKLRQEAKTLGIKKISQMKKAELVSAIQFCNTKGTQTEFNICESCLKIEKHEALIHIMKQLGRHKTVLLDDGMEIDVATGEVLGYYY